MLKNFYIVLISLTIFINTESFSLSKCSKNDTRPVLLETTSGKLSGFCEFIQVNDNNPRESRSGNVYTWLSIPYAQAPINQNRFKAPIEVHKQPDTIDATKWPNSCIQSYSTPTQTEPQDSFPGFTMWNIDPEHSKTSEDCLYLNIWIPADAYFRNSSPLPPNTEAPKFPILVFFHGGGTISGSTAIDMYNPSTFVAATNTIVITVNYRLGIFGFLYLENQFPGNQALLDQNMALKWIQSNAEKFGGDANKVTISGHSAGAVLAGFHLFYKDSWTLFRNAILQSGSPLISSVTPISGIEASQRARDVLRYVGCVNQTSSDSDIALCAQNADNLDKASFDYLSSLINGNHLARWYLYSMFVPVIDGHVLAQSPLESMKVGNFKKCPILTGFTTDEGNMYTAYSGLFGLGQDDIRKQQNVNHTTLISFLKSYFSFYPTYPQESSQLMINSVLHEYTKILDETNMDGITSPLIKPSYFSALSKIIGDQMFKCPAYKFADLLAKENSEVYVYLFAHRVSSTPWPGSYGATHGDEMAFTFAHTISSRREESIIGVNPWANPKHRYSNGEKALTRDIVTYWSNFVWSSSPNRKSSGFVKNWPKYTLLSVDAENMTDPSESVRYLILKTNGTRVNRGYALDACQFWNSYLPSLLKEVELVVPQTSETQMPVTCPTVGSKQFMQPSQEALREEIVVNKSDGKSSCLVKILSFVFTAIILIFFC